MRNSFKQRMIPILLCTCSFMLGAFFTAEKDKILREDVMHASKITGMVFSQSETDSMISLLEDQRKNFKIIDNFSLGNSVPPCLVFDPVPAGMKFGKVHKPFAAGPYAGTVLPKDMNELAFYSVGQLAELIRTKKISSVQLTKFFLTRLKKYNSKLLCVITFTEELAMQQAQKADQEIAAGKYRGLLHGIPYGIKDMFTTKGYNTTFGTTPYKDQRVEEDATVVKKLQDAGAVLLAKLSLGELAMDDVWFGGQTRCPWDTTKGSSGSSAGPASSVAAGLLPFAIGSETWGSIVSPSTVCGVTGLRPTFGRVSRAGAMALSWSMDKIGPICRNAEDCAIVFNAIYGPDDKDRSVKDFSFNYCTMKNIKGIKVGYFKNEFEKNEGGKITDNAALNKLQELGAVLVPLEFPVLPVNDLQVILFSECGAAFNELTLTGRDDLMAQQGRYNWPNFFRASHFIPATEYIQANRIRYLLIEEMAKLMKQADVLLVPSLAGDNLLMTNLTGHPSIVLPNGFANNKIPASIVFTGQLYNEAALIAIAKVYQDATGFQMKHPPDFIK